VRTYIVEIGCGFTTRASVKSQKINLNLFSSNNHEQTYEPMVAISTCMAPDTTLSGLGSCLCPHDPLVARHRGSLPIDLLDLPRVRHGSLMWQSCSPASLMSTMADDTLHTHKHNGTPWSGIRTRTAPSTVNATRHPLSMPHYLPRVQNPHCSLMQQPCSLSVPPSTLAGNDPRKH
jgi:hypothetical protein